VGQKTHPLGFRLGITQKHKSSWYTKLNQYSQVLEEDDKIRTYLNRLTKSTSISNIQINRNSLNDQIELNIETGRPGALVGDNGLGIETLLTNIKQILSKNKQVTVNILEVKKN
jgi:small subunit ribosomal protein S3